VVVLLPNYIVYMHFFDFSLVQQAKKYRLPLSFLKKMKICFILIFMN